MRLTPSFPITTYNIKASLAAEHIVFKSQKGLDTRVFSNTGCLKKCVLLMGYT